VDASAPNAEEEYGKGKQHETPNLPPAFQPQARLVTGLRGS
jgi:hypothetical protein